MAISTPDWVRHAIFYQIFPDRFAQSPRTRRPEGLALKPWGSPPEEQGFQGGDLLGIVDRLDYLEALGVTALYLNPIFASAANHRYHTFDYFQVDPLLGGGEALRALLDETHARGMRVVLDGVFNHASRGFWPFHHILENMGDSPYLDWFIIHKLPLRPYCCEKGVPPNYEAWWDLPALPKLNTNNPGVRSYLMEVARHWIEFGADGWRLDVPNEIDDDAFWREFRQVVKAANPEAYIVGEIWGEAQRWLQGDQFDAVMNYIFAWAAMSFFGGETLRPGYSHPHLKLQRLDAPAFGGVIDWMHGLYDWAIDQVQLNLLDSHDMARALWIMGDDKSALRLSVLFQMTMPGAPCIYYGDEIGLSSAGDPYCRAAFPWHAEDTWDLDLLSFYRRATALRHRYPVLRTGTFQAVHAADKVYAFHRKLDGAEALVIFNTGTEPATLKLALPGSAGALLSQAWPADAALIHRVNRGELAVAVPARQALILTR
jgi:neopullulanase